MPLTPILQHYADLLYGPQRRTQARAWAPLDDTEWAVLSRYVYRHTAGRPVRDPRGRLDAIFWLACQPGTARWADLPERFGKPDTVHRQFRRWAKAGLWTRLLQDLAEHRDLPGGRVLAAMASWICRAYRRTARLLGLAGILLARRLGFLSALRGPPWLVADPDLSVWVLSRVQALFAEVTAGRWPSHIDRPWLRSARYLLRSAQGRGVPRRLIWP